MTLRPGVQIGNYAIEALIGQGGMATVYRVRHLALGSQHALKVLTIASLEIRDRLVQEGRVQAVTRHPNIVTVTDLVDVGGSPGLIMEYIRGPALDALLRTRRLTIGEALVLTREIVDAVAAAHRAGLVHRDLKPANVLLEPAAGRLVPKVADFGIAKVLSGDPELHRTRSGVGMGTPSYMAPEQIRDARNVDARADIFSLGAILYELVTGSRAFVGGDMLDIFKAVDEGRYTPPTQLVPDLPPRVLDAIVGALQVDPNKRLQDCADLLRLLDDPVLLGSIPAPDWSWARSLLDESVDADLAAPVITRSDERAPSRSQGGPPTPTASGPGTLGSGEWLSERHSDDPPPQQVPEEGGSRPTPGNDAIGQRPIAPPPRLRMLVAAVGLALAALVVVLVVVVAQGGGGGSSDLAGAPAATEGAPSAAEQIPYSTFVVLPFKNLAGVEDLAWLGTALAQSGRDRVGKLGGFTVKDPPGPEVRAEVEARLGPRAAAVELGKRSGALWVVHGHYVLAGGELRLSGEVVLTDDGSTLKAVEERGGIDELMAIQDAMLDTLMTDLAAEVRKQETWLKAREGTDNSPALDAFSRAWSISEKDRGWNSSNYEVGTAALQEALRLDPGFVPPRLMLADLYHLRWMDSGAAEYHSLAMEEVRRVLEIDPDSVEALTRICRLLSEDDQPQEALAHCERARQLDPDLGTTQDLAGIYIRLDRDDDAEHVYRKLLETDPEHAWLQINVASFYLDRGRLDEALVHARGAARLQDLDVELGSDSPNARAGNLEAIGAHLLLGRVLQERGELAEAEQEYRTEVEQARGRPHAVGHKRVAKAWMGILLLASEEGDPGKMQEAAKGLSALLPRLSASDQNSIARQLTGLENVSKEVLSLALEAASGAVEGSGREQAVPLDTLAAVLERMGRLEEARKVNEEALALDGEATWLLERRDRLGVARP